MTDNNPEGVLTPTDLEPSDEHIRQLDDGRHVVHADGGDPVQSADDTGPQLPGDEAGGHDGHPDAEAVLDGTAPGAHADIAGLAGAHALAAGARAADTEDTVVADTDDVSEAFESLVYWYAGLVGEGKQPETVIATLLEHTDLDIEVNPR